MQRYDPTPLIGASRLGRTTIQDESYLQRYILENPDVLPLDQLRSELQTLVLVREFPTESGPIDALAMDELGNLYLIETKLYKNADKRLVIAQVLDYGAALWKGYSDPDDFVARLDTLMQAKGGKGLSSRIAEHFGHEGPELEGVIAAIKETVATGQFKFVILMDKVEDRLKNLIAFVNSNSEFDVLGIGLDFYQHDGIDILVPTLYGAETKKTVTSVAGVRRSWDAESFLAEASRRLTPAELEPFRAVYDWGLAKADEVSYGTGAKAGSFNPKFLNVCHRSIFTLKVDGRLILNFGWLREPESTKEWRVRFGQALQKGGFVLPAGFETKWVKVSIADWGPRATDFIRILSKEIGLDA